MLIVAIGGVYEFRRRIHPFGSREPEKQPKAVDRPKVAAGVRGLFDRLATKGSRR